MENVLIIVEKFITNRFTTEAYVVSVFSTFLQKGLQFKVCLPKNTVQKLSILLGRSISALQGQELRDIFSLQMPTPPVPPGSITLCRGQRHGPSGSVLFGVCRYAVV